MANIKNATGFHDQTLAVSTNVKIRRVPRHWETRFTYTFENFFHPFVGSLIQQLNRKSLEGVMDATWQAGLASDFFKSMYNPSETAISVVDFFPKAIDVTENGPYANYNWELFFHIPMAIAVNLSKTQHFAEAQRWFHFIFDPTSNDSSVPTPKRFWKFLAFRSDKDSKRVDDLLLLLSQKPSDLSPEDQQLRQDVLDGYQAILNKPFMPYAVARTRHVSFQYAVVMKYLDNLIAWGDSLFQQDTIEAINEATQRYVLAANLLGPRPQQVPSRGTVRPKTFAQLKAQGLDAMGNALAELECQFPFDNAPPSSGSGDSGSAASLFGIGATLYFAIPRNDQLLGYWDIVADRLFKIRHCMNIAGVVRPLALFDPPLDPGMLVKAAAAGINIGTIVSGANQPVGPLRALNMIQKALELCGEVRSLGGSLLSALEKGDAERLALVRQRHEIQIQQMTSEVKFLQLKAAQEATKSLLTSRANALERYKFYQRELGLAADANVPDTLSLDHRTLNSDNFDQAYSALVGIYDKPLGFQKLPALKLAKSGSPGQQSGASGAGNLYLNGNEDSELNVHGPIAKGLRGAAMVNDTISGGLSMIPDVGVDFHWWGLGGHMIVFGGTLLASAGRFTSSNLNFGASVEENKAASAAKTASYQRRGDDYLHQYNLALHELAQIGRQILTSLIAEQVAQHEYDLGEKQIQHAQEVNDLLQNKFTGQELYFWMQGEISRLYYEYYRFAFDTARKAERAMKQELMRPEVNSQDFVKFNYWDGGRKGLLSGEALHLDVKRMEMAYHDNNKRELELTRHVSLRQLDPLALITLRSTGSCQVTIPEWLYDKDCPGHYMRRIKSVGLSVPCVVGPYTSVNCTLSLLKSSIRVVPLPKDGEYVRQGADDDRFIDYTGAVQSIVTSAANNDSGLFDTNLHDERFLPFEGSGAVGTWKIDLPPAYPAFDYNSVSDVILHIRYTARQGVQPVSKVQKSIDDLFSPDSVPNGASLALLFNLRQDFPTEWSAFVNGAPQFSASIRRDYFPYFSHGKKVTVTGLDVYAQNVSAHHGVGDPAAATQDLAANQAFTIAASADTVLVPAAGQTVGLIVRYSLAK